MQHWVFPDRTTSIGTTINAYLKDSTAMDAAAIHLLFVANRFEKRCAQASGHPHTLHPLGFMDAPQLSVIIQMQSFIVPLEPHPFWLSRRRRPIPYLAALRLAP